jgi:putative serine protease PepD
MLNKVLIGLLAVILVANGVAGFYIYTLTGEVDDLNGQLNTMREDAAAAAAEQAALVEAVRADVGALEREIGSRLDGVVDDIAGNLDRIEDLDSAAAAGSARITDAESRLESLSAAVAEFKPAFAADEVYDAARRTVVEISDGTQTIGSGFVYDGEGHVATAYHVIEELEDIYVILSDGILSPAEVVGGSEISDVAVLALQDAGTLVAARVGDSSRLAVGEPVLAIGHPFDEPNSLSVGVVSQLDRYTEVGTDTEGRWIANLIQFDAPANFGNSGGPLFDADGSVIGMVVARIGPELGDGISYAVSANKLRRVADAIIEGGKFSYPYLGLVLEDLTPLMAEAAGQDTVRGARISRIAFGSPAQGAGFTVGDIIVGINGVDIDSVATLTSYLGEHASPGDEADIRLVRNGSETSRTMTVGAR